HDEGHLHYEAASRSGVRVQAEVRHRRVRRHAVGNDAVPGEGRDNPATDRCDREVLTAPRVVRQGLRREGHRLLRVLHRQPEEGAWSFNVKVQKAAMVKDAWTVTRWDGTWTRSAPAGG